MSVPSEPGVYKGVAFVDYLSIQAVNHTTLEGFRRTPAHARHAIFNPKDSAALAAGHAFHVFALEPELFAQQYAMGVEGDGRTKEIKAARAEWRQVNAGKLPITKAELDAFTQMRLSLLEHPTAAELLTGKGANELTILWLDKPTGLMCKARLDRVGQIGGYAFIGDLKTTEDAGERAFSRDVARYGYARQGAWYRDGLAELRPALRRYAFLAVEKGAPFCAAVHELDERALEQGARENRAFLDTYADCLKSGVWPGYPAGMSIIDVPAWAMDARD